MSKRIMNKVFSCADDCSIKIYCQDTDSIHLHYEDIDKVGKIYKDKCNQFLVGKYVGNFHIDFKMADACKDAEIYSIGSLFLGKHIHRYVRINR